MGVLPVSVDVCLYEMSAMVVAKSIGFDTGSVACLGLPRLFSDKIYDIICSRCVCGDDILFWVSRNCSLKRKRGALWEELRLKFARISGGGDIPLETVFDC